MLSCCPYRLSRLSRLSRLLPAALCVAGLLLQSPASATTSQAGPVPAQLSPLAGAERASVCASTMLGFARSAVHDMSAGELWDRSSRRYRMSEGLLAVAAALQPAEQVVPAGRQAQLAAIATDALQTPRQEVVDYCADVGVATFESLSPAEQALRRAEAREAFAALVAE